MTERELYRNISYNLKLIRKECGMTQEQFSSKLNISFYNYQRIEALNTKQTISISLLLNIANVLGIEIMDIIGGEKNEF